MKARATTKVASVAGMVAALAACSSSVTGSGSIVGCYDWNAGGLTMIAADGTVTKYCSPGSTEVCDTGTWTQSGPGTYVLDWKSGYVDTMTLSGGELVPVGSSNAREVASPASCP